MIDDVYFWEIQVFYEPRHSGSGPRLADNDEGDARPDEVCGRWYGIEETGLGLSDFAVLEVLLHKGPLPVNTIGPIVDLTPGSISIAVDRLVEKGLVSRLESAEDRRVRIVSLTPCGKDLIASAFRKHAGQMKRVFSELSPQELRVLEVSLKKVGKRAAALMEES